MKVGFGKVKKPAKLNTEESLTSKPQKPTILDRVSAIAGSKTSRRIESALVSSALIGLTALAGLAAFKSSDENALMQSMSIEQDLQIYSNHAEIFDTNLTSIFDRQFSFPHPSLREGNVSFMRDSVLHRHELACGRDAYYRADFQQKGASYLGCSMEILPNSDGVNVNTYSIGKSFGVTASTTEIAGHIEYRKDLTFPRDFKSRILSVTDKSSALDVARMAVDLQMITKGDVSEFTDSNGQNKLQRVLQDGRYMERWVAKGNDPKELFATLAKLESFPASDLVDYGALADRFAEGMDAQTLTEQARIQRAIMKDAASSLDSHLSIQHIRSLLDHNCTYKDRAGTHSGFSDHNNDCTADLGLHRSLPLKHELDKATPLGVSHNVHGTVENKFLLGSYKGHAVLTTLWPAQDANEAYVPTPAKKADAPWAQGYLAQSILNRPGAAQDDLEEHQLQAVKSAIGLHLGHEFAPHHVPIVMNQNLTELLNLPKLDPETQRISVELTLEHELKHIYDYKLHEHNGQGALNHDYEHQQAACDVYAVDQLNKKYGNDVQKLKMMREAILARDAGITHINDMITQEKITRAQSASDRIDAKIHQGYASLVTELRTKTVINFIDKKIKEIDQPAASPRAKTISLN